MSMAHLIRRCGKCESTNIREDILPGSCDGAVPPMMMDPYCGRCGALWQGFYVPQNAPKEMTTPIFSSYTSAAGWVAGPEIRESVSAPGSIEGEFERVLPWNIARWNPELRRAELWNCHLGHWQDGGDLTTSHVLSWDDTWAEPIKEHILLPPDQRSTQEE